MWCMEGDVDSDDSSGSENELQQQVEQLQAAVRIIPFNAQLRVVTHARHYLPSRGILHCEPS